MKISVHNYLVARQTVVKLYSGLLWILLYSGLLIILCSFISGILYLSVQCFQHNGERKSLLFYLVMMLRRIVEIQCNVQFKNLCSIIMSFSCKLLVRWIQCWVCIKVFDHTHSSSSSPITEQRLEVIRNNINTLFMKKFRGVGIYQNDELTLNVWN